MTVIVTEQEAKNQDEDNVPGCSKNFDQRIKRFKETGGQIIHAVEDLQGKNEKAEIFLTHLF